MAASAGPVPERRTPSEMLVMAAFLCGAFCIGLPQNVISANLTPMARHFHLSDAERDLMLGGWMNTAFFLVGAPASVAVGVLVDRLNRKGMLLGLCCLTGLTSLLSAMAQSVWQLVALRAVLGFATGALQPLMYSVVGDLFPPAARPALASYVGIAIGGGVAVGQLFAGLISRFGWRLPFLAIALASSAAALGIVAGAIEPTRKSAAVNTPAAEAQARPSQADAAAAEDAPPRASSPSSSVLAAWVGAVTDLRRQLPAILGCRTTALLYAQARVGRGGERGRLPHDRAPLRTGT